MAQKKQVPLSENERKFHPEWTADDCLNHLREIAEDHPNQVISRNFFRVHSDISEATWNRFFGTFAEFKKQAGVQLSRHAHRLERNIAKHASVSKMRDMNDKKMGFEGRYLRQRDGRWQSILNASDIHDKSCDPFWRRVFLDTAKRMQPDKVVLNGDIYDLPEFGKYNVDPRTWDVIGRIRWVHDFLRDLRKACPNTEIVLVEGNHEFRLMRHLAEENPAMMVILGELHGFTVSKLLGLDEFEVNYVARMDLSTFTERDIAKELRKNYYIAFDAVLFHHFPDAINDGWPGANGHHHKHEVRSRFNPTFGSYEWHQTGGGHMRAATYTAGEKWNCGFLGIQVDTHTRRSVFDYVTVGEDFAVSGGKFYYRTEVERLFPVKAVA